MTEVFVGEEFELKMTLDPHLRGGKAQLDWPTGLDGPERFDLNEGQTVVRCRATRRGQWDLTHIWLFWLSRLALFEFVPRLALGATINVVPNIRQVQSGHITSMVKSRLFGVKENRAIGEGSEFHQLRDFVPGMDPNSIDWKRSARHRSLVSKEVRAERNHHVIIALDNGYLMREEIAGLPKVDHAVTAALAVAWAAVIGGDLIGFFSYDTKPRIFMSPQPGRPAFARLRSRTAELTYDKRESNHTLAMTELYTRTPKRSLIIVFTDFVDTTTAELLVENVSVLAKQHLVVFVAIQDPELEKTVSTAPADFDGVAEVVSTGQILRERRLVLERLAKLGVTVVEAAPGTVTGRLVSTYLDIKDRELI